jgi:hypothetical protein
MQKIIKNGVTVVLEECSDDIKTISFEDSPKEFQEWFLKNLPEIEEQVNQIHEAYFSTTH